MPRNNIQWKLDKSFLAWRAMNCRRNTRFFYILHEPRFEGEGLEEGTEGGNWRGRERGEKRNALRQDGKIPANADCFNCSSAPFMYFTLTPTTLPSPRCPRARLFVPSVPSLSSLFHHPFTMILYYSGQFLRVLDGSKEITAGYPIYLLRGGKKRFDELLRL